MECPVLQRRGNAGIYNLSKKSVDLPDYDTVNTAVELIQKINNGEVFDVSEYVSSN